MTVVRGQTSVEFLLVLGASAILLSASLAALGMVKDAAEKTFAAASAKQLAERLAYACERALFTNTSLRFEARIFAPLDASTKGGALVLSFDGGRVSAKSLCLFSGEAAGRGSFEVTPQGDKALVVFHPD